MVTVSVAEFIESGNAVSGLYRDGTLDMSNMARRQVQKSTEAFASVPM
jgi:hypothetical protein